MCKKLKKIVLAGIILAMTVGFAGCGKKFDAAAYTKACLDAMYKGDYKEYAKQVEISEAEAKKEIEEEFVSIVEEGFEDLGTDEALQARYVDLMKQLYGKAKYEVGEAKETEKGYTVKVSVEPIDALKVYSEGMQEKVMEALEAGAVTEDNLMTFACDYLEECINGASYGEKQELEVKIEQDDDKVWEFSEEEIEKVTSALIDM